MNLQKLRDNAPLRDRLAAEYVLGTLRGAARRRFEQWKNDDLVAASIGKWESRLMPMSELATPRLPSPAVWQAIERRTGIAPQPASTISPRRAFWSGLRNDLAFWRGLGMTASVATVFLITMLATRPPAPVAPAATYVATLTDDKSQPVAVITGDRTRRALVVRMLARQEVASDKSLELWAVPKSGAPRSLGLMPEGGTLAVAMPDDMTPDTVPLLAISLEPKGGSPNRNAPTGPILFKGSWVQI